MAPLRLTALRVITRLDPDQGIHELRIETMLDDSPAGRARAPRTLEDTTVPATGADGPAAHAAPVMRQHDDTAAQQTHERHVTIIADIGFREAIRFVPHVTNTPGFTVFRQNGGRRSGRCRHGRIPPPPRTVPQRRHRHPRPRADRAGQHAGRDRELRTNAISTGSSSPGRWSSSSTAASEQAWDSRPPNRSSKSAPERPSSISSPGRSSLCDSARTVRYRCS